MNPTNGVKRNQSDESIGFSQPPNAKRQCLLPLNVLPTDLYNNYKLPNELWSHIFSFLPSKILPSLSSVCRLFNELLSSPPMQRFHFPFVQFSPEGREKEVIQQQLRLTYNKPIQNFQFDLPNYNASTIMEMVCDENNCLILASYEDELAVLNHILINYNFRTNTLQQQDITEEIADDLFYSFYKIAPNLIALVADCENSCDIKIINTKDKEINLIDFSNKNSVLRYFENLPISLFAQEDNNIIEYKLDNPLQNEIIYNTPNGATLLKAVDSHLLISSNLSFSPSSIICRKTKKIFELPHEISSGEYIDMTQNGIYVKKDQKIIRYDLKDKKTTTLNSEFNSSFSTIVELENSVFIQNGELVYFFSKSIPNGRQHDNEYNMQGQPFILLAHAKISSALTPTCILVYDEIENNSKILSFSEANLPRFLQTIDFASGNFFINIKDNKEEDSLTVNINKF